MMVVDLDPKTWIRGEGSSKSGMLLDDGRRCCLGFLGKKLGISDNCMIGAPTPASLDRPEAELFEAFNITSGCPLSPSLSKNTPLSRKMFVLNDNEAEWLDEYRVASLNSVLKAYNIDLRFNLLENK